METEIKNKLINICKFVETKLPLTSQQIFNEFDLLSGHPWKETAKSDITTYYPCLYGLVQNEVPQKILEIGTAFGLSAATMLKAAKDTIELFISIDLGIYGQQLGFQHNNIEFAKQRIHNWCSLNNIPLECVRFYCANTQPTGKGDNDNLGLDILRWHQIPELVRILITNDFDIIFIDGKHTEDGLLNDLTSFWPFLKPGGLVICDDLHDRKEYKDTCPWAGDTVDSFKQFLDRNKKDICDSYIWNYPQVPPGGKLGLRPFGLIRKKQHENKIAGTEGFEVFDCLDAIRINIARQEHLASLGLDLYKKSVLEVGAGVGWHTGFFEKMGCLVISTDARPLNVMEHLRRFPHRKVVVADLSIPGSHAKLGKFDIVYIYGTLYHTKDPSLCIKELSELCNELFLLETCVNPVDNGRINLVTEDKNIPNQSYEGIGCRPGRDWIMAELRKYFPYVYLSVTQPYHPEFPLYWPASLSSDVLNTRSIFVASKKPINLPTLTDSLLERQSVLEPIFCLPKVSIITICRNAMPYIKDCIESILSQVYPNIEYIIQDGASTDGTVELLKSYGDKIKWLSEPDSGHGEAMNRALKRCSGEIIGTCNADDMLMPYAASWAVESFKNHPEMAAIYGDYVEIDDRGNTKSLVIKGPNPYSYERVLCVEDVIPMQSAFFKREALKEAGLLGDGWLPRHCEDFTIWANLGLRHKISYLPGFVSKYRVHRGSETNTPETYKKFYISKRETLERFFLRPDLPDSIRAIRSRALSGLALSIAGMFLGRFADIPIGASYLNLAKTELLSESDLERFNNTLKSLDTVWHSLIYKGLIFLGRHDFEKAYKVFDILKAVDFRIKGIHFVRAICLSQLGRHDEAVDAYNKEIELHPEVLSKEFDGLEMFFK